MLVAAAAAVLSPSPAHGQPPECDRGCLEDLAGRYMAALVAHEPDTLPWAERVRFTENEVPLMIGDGAWGTVTKISATPYVVADPAAGNVLWYGTVEEHGQPAYFAVRLGVEGRKIAEVESVVGREGTPAPFAKTDGYELDASFSARVPAGERVPRERLVALADGYYNTMQLNDGQLLTAFDPNCRRITNGVTAPAGVVAPSPGGASAAETDSAPEADTAVKADTAAETRTAAGKARGGDAESCETQFENGLYKPVDRVRARRFPVVDEERGVVVAIAFFDHAARYVDYRTLDGVARKVPIEYPNSHVVLELIKLENGRVHRIEGVAAFLPYLMPTIWLH